MERIVRRSSYDFSQSNKREEGTDAESAPQFSEVLGRYLFSGCFRGVVLNVACENENK